MNNNDIFLNVKWKVQLFKFECLLTLKPLNCNSYSGQKWYKSAWFSMIFFNWGSSEKGICLSVCLSVSNKRQSGRTDFVWNWKLTWPKGRFIKSQKLKVWSENMTLTFIIFWNASTYTENSAKNLVLHLQKNGHLKSNSLIDFKIFQERITTIFS